MNLFHLFIILPVEGCSANSRKLVFLKVLARDRFLNFLKMNSLLPFSAHTLVFNSPKHDCFNAEFDTNIVKTRV